MDNAPADREAQERHRRPLSLPPPPSLLPHRGSFSAMRPVFWPLLLWPVIRVSAKVSIATLPDNEGCVTAVYSAYSYIAFAGTPAEGFWETRCRNPLKVTSIYAASDVYCSPTERTAGFLQLAAFCQEFAGIGLLPREEVAGNLTDDAVRHMRTVEFGEIPRDQLVNTPVMLSPSYYEVTFKTINFWQFQLWFNSVSAYATYAYWAAILLIGTFFRFSCHIIYSQGFCVRDNPHPFIRALCIPFRTGYQLIQTYILIPPPLASSSRRILWWTFPTRVEAIIALLFWLLSTILCAVGYRTFQGNLYWPDVSTQILRYVGDRTGVVSFANFPLIWLFAGRNNIFLWATGWSFATFNLFHRHIAWVATVQAIVHTVLYIVIIYNKGNLWKKLQKPYLFWGTLGMVAMALILPTAIDFVRRRAYETFLLLHIFFSLVTLVCCFYHTVIFEGHEYWNYLWPTVVIWVIDRFLRLTRLVYCNLHVRFNSENQILSTKSTAIYDEAADVIRLDVLPAYVHLSPAAGQYFYLYQPLRITGWESHPFTLGAWSYETGSPGFPPECEAAKDDQSLDVSQAPLLSDGSPESHLRAEAVPSCMDRHQQLKLVFWIRPFDGWTRHLRQQCMQLPNKTINTSILLEGPYGQEFPLWNYESVLLIAGGTGIAAIIPYILGHLERKGIDDGQSASSIKDIHLVWTTRQTAFIENIAKRELKPALVRDDFRASLYSTAYNAQHHEVQADNRSIDSNNLTDKDLEIFHGRPNIESLIMAHAHEARLSDCSAAVLVCGPPAMADESRAAVHFAMRRGYRDIQYVEESFSW